MSPKGPPKWALNFLHWFCKEEYLDEIEGDLVELHQLKAEQSLQKADWFFIWNVLRAFHPINFKNSNSNNWTMNLFKNYTKIYFRRVNKEKGHYLINILGLALGFAVLFFILIYTTDENGIDGFYSKKERVFRVVNHIAQEDGSIQKILSTPGPLAQALKNDFPSIESVAHLTCTGSQVISVGDKHFADREWAFATPEIFNILDFEIIEGNPTDTSKVMGVVLSEDLSMRLFGTTQSVGRSLDDSRLGSIEVIAVMKDSPSNATYKFNNIYVLNKYDFLGENWNRFINSWGGRFTQTWVLFKEGANPSDVLAHKKEFIEKNVPENNQNQLDFYFQNLTDIHLGSSTFERGGMGPVVSTPYSDRQFVNITLTLGLFVLLIAGLNYVNLSSVQALKRTLEASMRKINGANNRHLMIQLFYETLLTILIAYTLSALFIWVFFPYFQNITGKELDFLSLYSLQLIGYQVVTLLIVWILSAAVPALYYSRLKRSLLILKNAFSGKGDLLRKTLVGLQYALSIFLIIGSITIYRQLNFIQSKNLGFNNDNLIVLDINSGAARNQFKEIIHGIKQNAHVINASTSSRVPGEWKNLPKANLARNLSDQAIEASHYGVDQHWIPTFQMNLMQGKNFSGNDQVDSLCIIINDQAVKQLELQEPIGRSIWVMNNNDSVKMTIIGIIEDFHYESLFQPIGPLVLTSWNNHVRSIDYFTIRYASNPKETLEHIEKVNAQFDPETPAEINFLNEQWQRYYKSEESRGTIILIASTLSILISAFGLFGLINFTAERKTKEIGVRKVLGATPASILHLVLRDYVLLLIMASCIATPLAWWTFENWLSNFAYRIKLSPDLFLIAFMAVLVISFTTVIIRMVGVVQANPVHSIRYE